MENRAVIDKVINSTGSMEHEKLNDNIFACFDDKLKAVFQESGVTEIMIKGTNNVYIEKHGLVCELDFGVAESEMHRFIDSVAQYNSRNIDFNHPVFDGKLPGGFRCNIVMQPVSLDGVAITLRKHTQEIDSFDVLLKNRMMDEKTMNILKTAVDEKLNIIISGGTGTGKTYAYLIPCLLSGKKALISTATKTLQDQLFFKDIPIMKEICRHLIRR